MPPRSATLGTEDGKNLLAAYKRAANILRIENAKDGPHTGGISQDLFAESEESTFFISIGGFGAMAREKLSAEDYDSAMRYFSELRPVVDMFFEKVTVNADLPELRRNRLRLLAQFVGAVQHVADFSKIES